MATEPAHARPLSPHLTAWKWGPNMLVSILHRVTGDGMATVGTILFVWWLAALASGEAYYAQFTDWFTYSDGRLNAAGYIIGVGMTWAFFQHLMSGIRHFVMDTGAGYELKINKAGAILTILASVVLTAAFWAYLVWGK